MSIHPNIWHHIHVAPAAACLWCGGRRGCPPYFISCRSRLKHPSNPQRVRALAAASRQAAERPSKRSYRICIWLNSQNGLYACLCFCRCGDRLDLQCGTADVLLGTLARCLVEQCMWQCSTAADPSMLNDSFCNLCHYQVLNAACQTCVWIERHTFTCSLLVPCVSCGSCSLVLQSECTH